MLAQTTSLLGRRRLVRDAGLAWEGCGPSGVYLPEPCAQNCTNQAHPPELSPWSDKIAKESEPDNDRFQTFNHVFNGGLKLFHPLDSAETDLRNGASLEDSYQSVASHNS